jgi:hypothetical protein
LRVKLKDDTDEAFIRRLSLDLREVEPTPAEVHFFVQSKEANKRKILIDLFVKERLEKENKAEAEARKQEALAKQYQSAARLQAALALEKESMAREALRLLHAKQQEPLPGALEVLKIKVERARLTVKEKQILLEAELEKNKRLKGTGQSTDDRQVQLLQIELQRAELELREAEITLEAATKPPAKTSESGNTPMK